MPARNDDFFYIKKHITKAPLQQNSWLKILAAVLFYNEVSNPAIIQISTETKRRIRERSFIIAGFIMFVLIVFYKRIQPAAGLKKIDAERE